MTQEISLPSGCPAYRSTPGDGRTPERGVVVAPDIGGLRPLFDDLCQGLANEHAWSVCAPEPWPGRESLTLDERLDAVATLHDVDVLGDLAAAADATGSDRVGIIGFCLGGMYAMKAADHGRFDRVAAFYGMIRVPERWRSEHHREPLDAVEAEGGAPVLAVIGTADEWTPPEDVDALERAGAEVVRYAGARHGFVHDPSRHDHRADYAADAWRRVVTWIDG